MGVLVSGLALVLVFFLIPVVVLACGVAVLQDLPCCLVRYVGAVPQAEGGRLVARDAEAVVVVVAGVVEVAVVVVVVEAVVVVDKHPSSGIVEAELVGPAEVVSWVEPLRTPASFVEPQPVSVVEPQTASP